MRGVGGLLTADRTVHPRNHRHGRASLRRGRIRRLRGIRRLGRFSRGAAGACGAL